MNKTMIMAMNDSELIAQYKDNLREQDELWKSAENAEDIDETEVYLARYLKIREISRKMEIEISYRRIRL